jgi:hypothetical protein
MGEEPLSILLFGYSEQACLPGMKVLPLFCCNGLYSVG